MSAQTEIRVRFAPSPTGYLHLGGLRTALFNYLYARSQGGKFILRIEDTDRSRFVPGALENLLEIFSWLKIEFDEGPHIGGKFAPYIQSQRLDLYRQYSQQLLSAGKAYRCFCAPDTLEEMRKFQIAAGENPMYDRRCRNIPPDESADRSKSQPYVLRLKMPLDGVISFNDGVRGQVAFEASAVDDQVLVKSDGYPTYHLANVVDDHLMEISDVIRGEEWLTSAPKHIHLYHAFGWRPPNFYHLPLLLNKDRSKLSKRQGDVAAEDYRTKGYLPDALINYSALLGWHPLDDQEYLPRPELERRFSLDRVNKSGAVFDLDKLNWLNRQYLNALSEQEFLNLAASYIPSGIEFCSETGRKLLVWLREGLDKLSDITARLKPLCWDWQDELEAEAEEMIKSPAARLLYPAILNYQSSISSWNADAFKEIMQAVSKKSGIKGKDLWMAVRAALTGCVHGPEMALIVEKMGPEKFFEYIQKAQDFNAMSGAAT